MLLRRNTRPPEQTGRAIVFSFVHSSMKEEPSTVFLRARVIQGHMLPGLDQEAIELAWQIDTPQRIA
jgi:hypothetical protein